jgi:hypothetical protein
MLDPGTTDLAQASEFLEPFDPSVDQTGERNAKSRNAVGVSDSSTLGI